MRACVRACMRARACVRVCVCVSDIHSVSVSRGWPSSREDVESDLRPTAASGNEADRIPESSDRGFLQNMGPKDQVYAACSELLYVCMHICVRIGICTYVFIPVSTQLPVHR